MNPKTKKTTNFPRSKLGIAGAVFSLWAIAVYSAGLLNPLQASQDTTLKVNGVQNHVQYLTSLVITGTNGNVEFKYHQATNSVQALGALNMQNIVIEDKNAGNAASNPSAVILGGTGNTNNGQNSVILGGSGNRNEGQNNLLVNTTDSNAISFNTAIIRGQRVWTDGKNIFVNNANNTDNKEIKGENIFINGSSFSKDGNNVAIFGSKVTNTKSNVFIFNGNNAEFNPNLDSAFYANGKVAINGSNAVGTLHVHGGVMVQNRESGYKNPNQSGIIALFSRGVQKGLCGYDGKMRVPLSESARLYGLCAPRGDIVGTRPANAVSNWETILPQVWNQQNWTWEARKWIYGSDTKPGYFLCKDGFVPYPTDALGKTNDGFVRNPTDALGKTGVWCKPCETAKKGYLNCPEKASPKPEPTPVQPSVPGQPTCPSEGTWNGTSCVKPLKCLPNQDTNGTFSDGVQTYNGSTWEPTTLCTLNCNSGYEKKTGADWREHCDTLEKRIPITVYINPNSVADWSLSFGLLAINRDARSGLDWVSGPLSSISETDINSPDLTGSAKSWLRSKRGNMKVAKGYIWDFEWDLTNLWQLDSMHFYYFASGMDLSSIQPVNGTVSLGRYWSTISNSHKVFTADIEFNELETIKNYGIKFIIDSEYGDKYRSQPITTPPVSSPQRQSIPMQFINYTHGWGNECNNSRSTRSYEICLPSDWKSAFWISWWPIYSNVGDNFFSRHNVWSKEYKTIYVKTESMRWSAQKHIYFYTDAGLTQKAPRGYYSINAGYAGYAGDSDLDDLNNSGIKGVFVDDSGKVKSWVGEKGFSEVNSKYYF